ncbi:MAG: diaminopimelate decarboxylase [Thermomicrobiales bacterium]|nr:MAG: diaminopimelate decarboxylase [Thermomicrobiales bacterium]
MIWPETVQRADSGELVIGGCSVVELARRFETPLYVFDEQTLRHRARRVRLAFERVYSRTRVVYAAKAFLSLRLARLLHEEGLGLDVVSGGELFAARRAGIPGEAITFHGNNKSERELQEGIAAGVGLFAVDNVHELMLLSRLASGAATRVDIVLRLNPGIDVHTHDKIKTGAVDSKFGFPLWTGEAEQAVALAVQSPGVRLVGYHVHLGSQLFDVAPIVLAIQHVVEFAARMRERHGASLDVLSPGGGFGIGYVEGQDDVPIEEWAAVMVDAVLRATSACELPAPAVIVEPGRWIVGPSAIAIYRVGAIKDIPGVRCYVAVDGGMADNVRPALYGARYTAALANRTGEAERELVTIAGKYCETGDVLIRDVLLPPLQPGDLLAIPAVGAYCLPLASNYNHACRPAVILVRDGHAEVIRRRETYEDLLACEVV